MFMQGWTFIFFKGGEKISGSQTAEYGFGAPEIHFGAVLGAPRVHYVIILDSLARPNPPIRFLPPICTVQLSAVYVDL